MAAKQYRALVGLNFGPTNKRYEPDDVMTDLPPDSIKWLVSQGYIRAVADEKKDDSPKDVDPAESTRFLPGEPDKPATPPVDPSTAPSDSDDSKE